MAPDKIGSLIGAVGGLVFVQANADAFSAGVELIARLLGVMAFVAVLYLAAHRASPAPVPSSGGLVGFATIVLVEVVGIAVGTRLLTGPADTAWIAFVVGAHFIALAVFLRLPVFRWLGYAVTACGVAGLCAAFLGASEPVIAAVAGLAPGALLFAAVGWPAQAVA